MKREKTTEEKKIVSFFNDLYQINGESEKSLGWSKNKQHIRFSQLLRFINEDSFSVLDIGCGFGDFYSYCLNSTKKTIDYWGIDLMPDFIDIAKKNHPEIKDRFSCGNYFYDNYLSTWDWIVGSGVFNLNLFEDELKMYGYIEKSIKKAFEHSKRGISFDFLSSKVDYKGDNKCFFSDPERILSIAYSLSRNLILNNSAMPFEFCLTLWKDDSFSVESTVFNTYTDK